MPLLRLRDFASVQAAGPGTRLRVPCGKGAVAGAVLNERPQSRAKLVELLLFWQVRRTLKVRRTLDTFH